MSLKQEHIDKGRDVVFAAMTTAGQIYNQQYGSIGVKDVENVIEMAQMILAEACNEEMHEFEAEQQAKQAADLLAARKEWNKQESKEAATLKEGFWEYDGGGNAFDENEVAEGTADLHYHHNRTGDEAHFQMPSDRYFSRKYPDVAGTLQSIEDWVGIVLVEGKEVEPLEAE